MIVFYFNFIHLFHFFVHLQRFLFFCDISYNFQFDLVLSCVPCRVLQCDKDFRLQYFSQLQSDFARFFPFYGWFHGSFSTLVKGMRYQSFSSIYKKNKYYLFSSKFYMEFVLRYLNVSRLLFFQNFLFFLSLEEIFSHQ